MPKANYRRKMIKSNPYFLVVTAEEAFVLVASLVNITPNYITLVPRCRDGWADAAIRGAFDITPTQTIEVCACTICGYTYLKNRAQWSKKRRIRNKSLKIVQRSNILFCTCMKWILAYKAGVVFNVMCRNVLV